MVKCRNHPYEQGVGVCASCLRERLLAVVAAQSGRPQHCCAGTPVQQGPPAPAHLPRKQQQGEKQTQTPPLPLLFPRSVSPYVAHRRSVDLDIPAEADDRYRRRQPVRFYSTAGVGTAGGGTKRGGAGFSILSSLFGGGGRQFRSEDSEQDPVASSSGGRPVSWFASLIVGGKKKKKKKKDAKHFDAEMAKEDSATRREWCGDRGMSPAGNESCGEDGSDPRSGYSTESPNAWQRPEPTPLQKPATPAHSAMSGFVFCLSPLVRATPRRSHAAEVSTAAGIAGEPPRSLGRRGHCRRQHHHRLASGGGGPPSLGPNRSRKLADFGRFR